MDVSDEEDLAYHELFEDAQKAVHDSEANQKRSQAVREELEAYIDSSNEKTGSDGQALIRIPSNFDTIVNSMNRDDLSAGVSDEKPWSQYLLLDGLNADDDTEYNGRYNRTFHDTSEAKIQRGLAQIQLLDRQLQEASKRSVLITARTDDTEIDETFITNNNSGRKLRKGSDGNDLRLEKLNKGEKVSGKFDTAKEQEQQRLTWLLGADLDGEEMRAMGSYWDADLQAQKEIVDEKLAEFGRWELLQAGDSGVDSAGGKHSGQKPVGEGERRPDYLDELRSARIEKEYVERLNNQLQACTSNPIMYEALLPMAPLSQANAKLRGGGRGSVDSSVVPGTGRLSSLRSKEGDLHVPAPQDVQPDKPVTFEDIRTLVALLNGFEGRDSFPASNSPGQINAPPGSSAARSKGVDTAGIKALVQQYKADIDALGRIRAGTSLSEARVEAVTGKGTDMRDQTEGLHVTASSSTTTTISGRPAVVEEQAEERWLDLSEEAPVPALNVEHHAVLGAGRRARADYHASPRAEPTAERLPPIPPAVFASNKDAPLPFSQPKRQSSLAFDCEDEAGARLNDAEVRASPERPVKSLRVPRSVLNAQLPSSHTAVATTVFKAVNARLASEAAVELDAKISNGARLAKKIGATLANNVTTSGHHQRDVAAAAAAAADGSTRQPRHRHPSHDSQQHQVSPNSARRALKASNVLSSMSSSGKAPSDSMLI